MSISIMVTPPGELLVDGFTLGVFGPMTAPGVRSLKALTACKAFMRENYAVLGNVS